MPQIRIDVDDNEFQALQGLAVKMGAPTVASAVRQVALKAADVPQPVEQIISDVFAKIDAMSIGTEFTTGELLRELYTSNFTYTQRADGSVAPSVVSARVGRTLAAKTNMLAHNYVVDRIVSRTNVFRKVAPGGAAAKDGE